MKKWAKIKYFTIVQNIGISSGFLLTQKENDNQNMQILFSNGGLKFKKKRKKKKKKKGKGFNHLYPLTFNGLPTPGKVVPLILLIKMTAKDVKVII